MEFQLFSRIEKQHGLKKQTNKKKIKEVTAENFPNLAKKTINWHIQEVEKTPNRIKAKANISESKTLTAMKKSLEQPRERHHPERETTPMVGSYSSETMVA